MDQKAGRKYVGMWIGIAVTLLVGGGLVFAFSFPGMGKAKTVKAEKGQVVIAAADVADGDAHFYRFNDGGKDISFFVVKGSDGELRTAFDACDVCYREKKGYTREGSFMNCRNCGRKFAIDRIGPHAIGGCNPSHLPHRLVGKSIIFSVDDLKSGVRFF